MMEVVTVTHWLAGAANIVKYQDVLDIRLLMLSVANMVTVTVKIVNVNVLEDGLVLLVILLTVLEHQTAMIVVFVMNGALILQNVRTVRETGWDQLVMILVLMVPRHL